DPDLLDRLSKRPKTVLNPNRMRSVKGLDAAREWLGGEKRSEILEFVERQLNVSADKVRGHDD
ncbi:MAG: hypothetical protein ACREA0_25855, partial [bacterium]